MKITVIQTITMAHDIMKAIIVRISQSEFVDLLTKTPSSDFLHVVHRTSKVGDLSGQSSASQMSSVVLWC